MTKSRGYFALAFPVQILWHFSPVLRDLPQWTSNVLSFLKDKPQTCGCEFSACLAVVIVRRGTILPALQPLGGVVFDFGGRRHRCDGGLCRTVKIWDVGTRSCLVTLGGHVHRVCWSSLRRDLDLDRGKMATASLDGSLKIWDLAACLTGGVPTVGGLHYVVLRASDDRRCVAHNQGWGLSCQLTDVTSRKVLDASTPGHRGFVDNVAFTRDSTRLVTLDTGHRGQYTVCSQWRTQYRQYTVCSPWRTHLHGLSSVAYPSQTVHGL